MSVEDRIEASLNGIDIELHAVVTQLARIADSLEKLDEIKDETHNIYAAIDEHTGDL